MRILLWYWGRRGGGPRYTLELARALSSEPGVELALSLSRQNEIYADFEGLGIARFDVETYHDVPSAITANLGLPFLRRQFWKFVKEQKIDLIIGTMSHLWNAPMLFGKLKRPPYVMVVHDAVPHPGDDLFFRYWLLKQEAAGAQAAVALTEFVRQQMCDAYPYPKARTWVIPHGVFPYAKAGASLPNRKGRQIRILFFGRLLPYKGLDLLLDAHEKVRNAGVDVHLHIAGPGDISPYEKRIAQLDEVSVDNRWIPEDEIATIFSDADISVLPYREASQSGVTATSFAAGVPVIVTPVGGLAEQVHDGVNGLVCSGPSAEEIAAAITRMATDETLLRACSQGASHTAEFELSWTGIARRFHDMAQHVVQMQPG